MRIREFIYSTPGEATAFLDGIDEAATSRYGPEAFGTRSNDTAAGGHLAVIVDYDGDPAEGEKTFDSVSEMKDDYAKRHPDFQPYA